MVALQRFGSAAQGDPVPRAADQLGKLLRPLFLCDYFGNVAFRRELHTLLNHGESVHQLQRAIRSTPAESPPSAVDVAMKWSPSRVR
nr:Tn3 family transposase [Burkholderia ubonensis]